MGQCQRAAGHGRSLVRVVGVQVMEEDGDIHHDSHVCSGAHREADVSSASASLQPGKDKQNILILYI